MAVVGAGAFGRNHLRVLHEMPGCQLAAVVDADKKRAGKAAAEFDCAEVSEIADFDGHVDAAIVATPTGTHAPIGCALMEAGIDVLVEKPIAANSADALRLTETAQRTDRILQVGHLERFNPAVQALAAQVSTPLFFEINRMSVFTARSLDIDVVLDLMIHDLDIVLALTNALPNEIRAAGISVLSKKVDIANVRLAFEGGCIANLTASRVSMEKIRKLRLFQPDQYISIDYEKQEGTIVGISDSSEGFSVEGLEGRKIALAPLDTRKGEPLKLELESFLNCVRSRTPPLVGGEAASRALQVALSVLDKIEEHTATVAQTLRAAPATSSSSASS